MAEHSGTNLEQLTSWRPIRIGDAWVRKQGDQTAVYDPETGQLHMLNSSALALWEACDGETTLNEVIDALVELTGLSAEQARADVTRTIDELKEAGLVV